MRTTDDGRTFLSTQNTSKVRILNRSSWSEIGVSVAAEATCVEVTAVDALFLALAALACCGAGTKDMHKRTLVCFNETFVRSKTRLPQGEICVEFYVISVREYEWDSLSCIHSLISIFHESCRRDEK
jgi:hypothetical protein